MFNKRVTLLTILLLLSALAAFAQSEEFAQDALAGEPIEFYAAELAKEDDLSPASEAPILIEVPSPSVRVFNELDAPTTSAKGVAAQMDSLLGTKEVTSSVAAYFVLGAAGLIEAGEERAIKSAYDTAFAKGWLKAGAENAVTRQETAFLIMNAFSLKGGIMYSIFRNPRYAYREALYRGFIQSGSYSNMTVSGEEMLRIIDRVLEYSGGYD